MLRDLSLTGLSSRPKVGAQGGDELAKVAIAPNLPEAASDFQDSIPRSPTCRRRESGMVMPSGAVHVYRFKNGSRGD